MKLLKDVGLPDGFEGEDGDEPAYSVEVESEPQMILETFVFVCESPAQAACDRLRDRLGEHYGAMRASAAGTGDTVSIALTATNGAQEIVVQVSALGEEACGGYATVRSRWQWPTL